MNLSVFKSPKPNISAPNFEEDETLSKKIEIYKGIAHM